MTALAISAGSWVYKNFIASKEDDSTAKESNVKMMEGADQKGDSAANQVEPGQEIESLTCPITMAQIREPASTIYGHLFEMSAIKEWVKKKGTCPLTNQPLREDQIFA